MAEPKARKTGKKADAGAPPGSGINPFYLRADVLAQARAAMRSDPALPHVALGEFLAPGAFAALSRACAKGWKRASVPDQYSFSTRAHVPVQDTVCAFVQVLTGKVPLDAGSRRFSHRDFTLMHDEADEPAGILGLLFLEDFPEEWGGSVVFMRKGEMLARFTPARNTLLVVERKRGVKDFVHYVNHRAGKRVLTIVSA